MTIASESAVKLIHEAFLVHWQETGSAQLPRDRFLRMAVTAATQAASVKRAVDFTDATAASRSHINLGDNLVIWCSCPARGKAGRKSSSETWRRYTCRRARQTIKSVTDAIPLGGSSDGFRVVCTCYKPTDAGKVKGT